MADQKQDESFKVVDRRLFTAEGELRREALDEEQREKAAGKPPEASSAKSDGAASRKGEPTTAAATENAPASEQAPSRGFQMLVNFLAQNTAAMLGGMADPRTGKPFVDLEGAREMIDMLDALREKTMKNLATEDDQLLIDVIGSLKLSFMELSRAADQALREKAKATKR